MTWRLLLGALPVAACSGSPSAPSQPVTIGQVEGLLFGSGPVGFAECRGPRAGTWTTWPRGSVVQLFD